MQAATDCRIEKCFCGEYASTVTSDAHLSLKLDDPSFTAPIYANLFDDEGGEGYTLLWSPSSGVPNLHPPNLRHPLSRVSCAMLSVDAPTSCRA